MKHYKKNKCSLSVERIKKKYVFIPFIGLFLTLGSVFAQNKAQKLLDEVYLKTKAYKTLQAEFVYTYRDKNQKIRSRNNGKIYVLGNKYRLVLPENVQIFDGKVLYGISDEDKEISIVKEDLENLSPLAILERYQKGFKATWVEKSKTDKNPIQYIKLIPSDLKKQKAEYLLVGINIQKQSLVEFTEVFKDRSVHMELKNLRTNLSLNPNGFTIDIPKYKDYTRNEL